MIRFADTDTTPLVRSMWKTCFGDTEEYLDLHFSKKYKPENTLLYYEGDMAVAALQMLPYSIRFYGKEIPFSYLAGLCTLPEFRNKGYMGKLIRTSFDVLKERQIPLCGLVPAEDWLYGYYAKYGFETVFDSTEDTIDLSSVLSKGKDFQEDYLLFDKQYQSEDFCVVKTFLDFEAIVDDYKDEGCPLKGNLNGMARVVMPETVLALYAAVCNNYDFAIRVDQDVYDIKQGKVSKANLSDTDLSVDINLLTRLLFGYHISELGSPYSSLFQEHHPILNLMLE